MQNPFKKDKRCLSDEHLKTIFESIAELTGELVEAVKSNTVRLNILAERLINLENNSKKP